MEFALKRIYEPASPEDGYRVLVDRLWPRGVKKADADISCWAKEITPSPDLRKWFHEDKEGRFETFSERYAKELESSPEVGEFIRSIPGRHRSGNAPLRGKGRSAEPCRNAEGRA